MVEGMDPAIPDAVDTKPVTVKAVDGGAIPSIINTNDETPGKEERPTVDQGVDDNMEADIQEVIPEDVGQKKKSKKIKHKKNVDVGEISEPKRKLSKEERKAKRARLREEQKRQQRRPLMLMMRRANGGQTGYNLQLSDIVKVLIGGDVDTWHDKRLPSSKLSVMYAVLNKV
ncbi:hypothetical protein LIER_15466 [Lithospermum erythrorhizon]|uniref:Uncharacterized protein n=1 Tax=Lithospermum erythrorhizon TaxID=34254 RepID=A0AAV3Q4M8_LITER